MPVNIAGIRFKPAGKIRQYMAGSLALERGEKCIAESQFGLEVATVVIPPRAMEDAPEGQDLGHILRRATAEDLEQAEAYKQRSQNAMDIWRQRLQETGLEMKPVRVDYSLDGRKAIFYFTAEGRVDFRALVRYLAGQLKTRIEMRQIGVRDEAKQLGGYGVCGRPLCCSTFLTDFQPISVRMAKEQGLALNPSRISGVCGRLKCCLAYEVPVYKAIKDDLPRVGDAYMTKQGPGRVTNVTVVGEAFEVVLDETGERLFMRLPSAAERNYHCKGGCGSGGGCGSDGGCGSGGCSA
jgi:cell fate regulator YaaT (PSP1 superfamily)